MQNKAQAIPPHSSPHCQRLWIPAYAGMTVEGVAPGEGISFLSTSAGPVRRTDGMTPLLVMPGLVPGIHALKARRCLTTGMAGTDPRIESGDGHDGVEPKSADHNVLTLFLTVHTS